MPKELSDEPITNTAPVEPPAPIPAVEPSREEPQYEGYHHGQESSTEAASPAPTDGATPSEPALGVNMESLGFAEPPAPMPKPSEGLSLIDDMDDDTARLRDATPPLFPDVYDEQ